MRGRVGRGVRSLAKRGPDEIEIEAHPEEGAFADRDVAILGAFPATDEDGAAVEVDVSDCQVDQLSAPKRAGVEDLEDRAITEPEWRETSGDARSRAISLRVRVASGRRRSGFGIIRSLAGLVGSRPVRRSHEKKCATGTSR